VIERAREWWTGLSRRERIATAVATTFVVIAALYLVAIEPAWRVRTRLATDLPRLRAQAAEMDALAQEAKKLNARALTVDSPAQARAALVKLAAEKNLASTTVQDADNQRLVVAVRKADATSTLALLKDAASELPLRISTARISRTAPGIVDADVTLIPVGGR
jgi:type II secretory pathway component PulM